MCEMLGFSSQEEKDITAYLNEFFSHSVNNPNGWGLEKIDSSSVLLRTEETSAENSLLLPELLKDGISSKTVLAHIRKATVGGVNPKNCHPFIREDNMGRMWSLMHNGTIFSGLELIQYQEKQEGDTDSERILLYLVDRINDMAERKGCKLNSFERFKVVEQVIAVLSYRNKLNLVIYDGEQMYIHVNMKNTLFVKDVGSGIIFATVPLDETGWEAVPLTTLFVYQDGTLKYRGKNHHNEYIDTIGAALQQYDYNI